MYNVTSLQIEITRKCNLKCVHCMRGEPQDTSINTKIIDRIFDCIYNCDDITFTGGEPLLEIDLIDYFIDQILKHKWSTKTIQLTTNATIKDKRIINIYKKFCQSTNGYALLRISDDGFHNKEKSKAAYEYYQKFVDLANKELNRTAVYLEFVSDDANLTEHMVYSGRAIDYINNNEPLFTPLGEIPVKYPYLFNHRIRIEDNTIKCGIYISANGNVGLNEERSFENHDKLSFGNILSSDFTDIINEFNDKCLLNCTEMDLINTYGGNILFVPGIKKESRICLSIFGEFLNKIIKTRLLVRELFSFLPAQDILINIKLPKDFKEVPILDIYNKYNEISKKTPDADSWLFLKKLLESDELFVLPNLMIGTKEELLRTSKFKALNLLNQLYRDKKIMPKNDKIFDCYYDYQNQSN